MIASKAYDETECVITSVRKAPFNIYGLWEADERTKI